MLLSSSQKSWPHFGYCQAGKNPDQNRPRCYGRQNKHQTPISFANCPSEEREREREREGEREKRFKRVVYCPRFQSVHSRIKSLTVHPSHRWGIAVVCNAHAPHPSREPMRDLINTSPVTWKTGSGVGVL